MNDAPLYQTANSVQRRDAELILEEFSHIMHWRPDGSDSILDIGCGSGDVTMDFILPILPLNFYQLVGTDISNEMIKFAKENYQHPRIKFEQMDISEDLDMKSTVCQTQYDHITSFYCLHWVQNQKKALQNIYKLLRPGGDCLLVFLASNPVFDIYEQLSLMSKWKPYMKDVGKFIGPYQKSKNPAAEFTDIMYAAGFSEPNVEVRENIFIYQGVENLKRNVKAINPFTSRMSPKLQEEFLDDYVKIVIRMKLYNKQLSGNDICVICPYKLMIAYATKWH